VQSACAAAFEALEPRLLLDAAPTVYDQYLLELINRGRADPAAEAARYGTGLNEGLPPGTISDDPKQPLAFNTSLIQAAQAHSQWMLDTNIFSHYGAGGSRPWDRAQAAGYPCGSVGENLSWQGTTGTFDMTQWTAEAHEDLYVDAPVADRGHRINQLNPDWREVGAGVLSGLFVHEGTTWNSLMVTEDFGTCGGQRFLTGVVYDDGLVLADDFYTPGEGLGGVTVTAVRRGDGAEFSAQTWPSGGYTLPLSTGTYDIHATNDQAVTLNLGSAEIDSQNVKVDAASDFQPPPARNWWGQADGRWGNAANWSAGVPPDPTHTAVFDQGAPHQPALYQDESIHGLDFRTTGWTISCNEHTLTIGEGGISFAGAGAPTSTIDLGTGNLVIDYEGNSPFDDLVPLIQHGFNNVDTDGDGFPNLWEGTGITSSTAAADSHIVTAVGVIDNSDTETGIGGLTEFAGVAVDETSVLAGYTWAGDVNLDGIINSNDYDRIDTNWMLWSHEGRMPDGGFRWAVGDLNYDGTINSNDYDFIDRAWILSEGAPLAGPGAPAATLAGPDAAPLAAARLQSDLTDSPEAAILAEGSDSRAAMYTLPFGSRLKVARLKGPFVVTQQPPFSAFSAASAFSALKAVAVQSAIRNPKSEMAASPAWLPTASDSGAGPNGFATEADLAGSGLLDPLALPALNVRL